MNPKRVFIACLALVALIVFVMRSRERPRTAASADLAPEGEGLQALNPAGKGTGAVTLSFEGKDDPRRRLPALAHRSGLNQVDIDLRRGATVPLFIVSEPRCGIGDYDLIADDLKQTGDSQLVLSLEGLGDAATTMKPVRVPLTLEKLASGFETSIRLPPASRGMELGMFICSDPGDGALCGRLPLIASKESTKPGAESRPRQRAFYFNYILLEPDKVSALADTEMEPPRYEELKKYVAIATGRDDAAVRSAKESNAQVSSVPLQLGSHGQLSVTIPRLMPECDLNYAKVRAK